MEDEINEVRKIEAGADNQSAPPLVSRFSWSSSDEESVPVTDEVSVSVP